MSQFFQFSERFNANSTIQYFSNDTLTWLEKNFSIHLPADFKRFATQFGNVWTPKILDLVVDNEISIHDVQDFWTIEQILNDKLEGFTASIREIFPFASDSGGSTFGFLVEDLKIEKETSTVYFYDHDLDEIVSEYLTFSNWISRFNRL